MRVLLFVVLGPLALPLLYKSPKFNKTLKIILTIAVIIYTSYLIFVSVELGGKCKDVPYSKVQAPPLQ